ATKSAHPQFNSRRFTGPTYDLRLTREGTTISFHGYYFACRYDTRSRSAELRFAAARADVHAMELENCLRVLAALVLREVSLFFFHAAAVHWQGRTWLFMGPHDAGKTTLASLAPTDAEVLGDDLNGLLFDA